MHLREMRVNDPSLAKVYKDDMRGMASDAHGVMWANDFRDQAEFDKWVLYDWETIDGITDPVERDLQLNQIRRSTADGVTGGACMEFQYLAGRRPRHSWGRIFSAQPGDRGYRAGDLPVSEKAAGEVISLPVYPELTADRIARVVEAIASFYGA